MYISKGNKKVNAAIFNLPCRKTCRKGLACHKFCYAAKAERLYPNVKPCREKNLRASKGVTFVSRMIDLIKSQKNKYFRIHESGDFYSQEYILKWYEICRGLPGTTFYVYTKRNDLFTPQILADKPDNLTLIYSLDGIRTLDMSKVDIPEGYDKVTCTHQTATNCPALANEDVKCMRDCFKCSTKQKEVIIFKKH
jgi:hypothetical protein